MHLNLNINENDISGSFQRIANELMNKWVIQVDAKRYRIAELEFYYWSELHKDPYVHKNELQKKSGKWYFHGSGIDLTFGDNGSYGGILIRAIYDFKGKNYVYGPLNCITELFSNLPNIYDSNSSISFGLIEAKESDFIKEKTISAPRVGLNPVKDEEKCKALYRFLVMPKYKHAEKTKIEESMQKNGASPDETKKIWG